MTDRMKLLVPAIIGGLIVDIAWALETPSVNPILKLMAMPLYGLPLTIVFLKDKNATGEKIGVGEFLLTLLFIGPIVSLFAGLIIGIPLCIFIPSLRNAIF